MGAFSQLFRKKRDLLAADNSATRNSPQNTPTSGAGQRTPRTPRRPRENFDLDWKDPEEAAMAMAYRLSLHQESDGTFSPAASGIDVEQDAIKQAMKASLETANYDSLLRDVAMWVYDLEGTNADVQNALTAAGEKHRKIVEDMSHADPDDPEGWHHLMWLSTQYPAVEERLKALGERLAPLNDAVSGLSDLRTFIQEQKPGVEDAEGIRDAVIAKLFEDLEGRGVASLLDHSDHGRGDVRDHVRALIEEAERIDEPPPLIEFEDDTGGPELTSVEPHPSAPALFEPEPETAVWIAEPIQSAEPDVSEHEREPELNEIKAEIMEPIEEPIEPTPAKTSSTSTTPKAPSHQLLFKPFHLSAQRQRTPRSSREKPPKDDSIKRMPIIVSVYNELQKDEGTVADAVGWKSNPHNSRKGETPRIFRTGTVSAGAIADEAATVNKVLSEMRDALSSWSVPPGSDVVAEGLRLADYMDAVSKEAGKVMHGFEPLRQMMTKQGIEWDENLTKDTRWASQAAACALMAEAMDQVRNVESKGMRGWEIRQVLKPLGHAVLGAFKVHQFSGGFNNKAWRVAEDLAEFTLHYARQVDPKWVRHTKVVMG